MRHKWVLGVGLAAVVAGPVAGQPVSPPQPPQQPVLGGFQPVSPTPPASPMSPTSPMGGYVPPVDGLRPAPAPAAVPVPVEIPSVLGKDHPWLIKPEHGAYFIMVKSYVRPAKGSRAAQDDRGLTARELAEMLAQEIRETYRVYAYLFEYVSEERKAEARQRAEARAKAQEYVAQMEAIKQKAALQGLEFLEPDDRLRVMTHSHRDQIGVLVGGFQTEKAALEALAVLKKWPTPKNDVLCDKGAITQPDADGKMQLVTAAINPYATAFVVPNPAIARPAAPAGSKPGMDPFVVKLNDDNPYSLLKAKKGWTLAVKSFTAPVQFVNKDADSGPLKRLGLGKDGGRALVAAGEQAEEMAKMLRAMKGRGGESLNLEAFVLHTRGASIVTVGQYDGPDDPALVATKRLLSGMTAKVTEDQAGTRAVMNAPTLFKDITPMPVPKP
jgi:hypothetical protein